MLTATPQLISVATISHKDLSVPKVGQTTSIKLRIVAICYNVAQLDASK